MLNAPYPSCHSKRRLPVCSCTHFEEPDFTSWIALAIAIVGGSERRMWEWLAIPPTASAFMFVGPGDSAHVRPEPGLKVFGNSWHSVFGGKHTMKQRAGSCVVGHRRSIVMSAVPAGTHLLLTLTRHLSAKALGVPGYCQSRLAALQALPRSVAFTGWRRACPERLT